MLSVVMLSEHILIVMLIFHYAEYSYAQCHYVEFCYTEYHGAGNYQIGSL